MNADDVKVNDASARTTAANAYVSGLGGSRHIVLFDTLLRDFPARPGARWWWPTSWPTSSAATC